MVVQTAFSLFSQSGASGQLRQFELDDADDNLISATVVDDNNNVISKDTYQYDLNGNSVVDTTTNQYGKVVGQATESINLITGDVQDTAIGFSETTGQQINEQQIAGNSNNVITDTISGQAQCYGFKQRLHHSCRRCDRDRQRRWQYIRRRCGKRRYG